MLVILVLVPEIHHTSLFWDLYLLEDPVHHLLMPDPVGVEVEED